ncbi:MAG: hypothetical protein IT437_02640 [Phycisphaerales bacterium]|nr:hypothetical protein [Phycisphaerales bacterium]
MSTTRAQSLRLYDGDGDRLITSEHAPDRVTLLPGGRTDGRVRPEERVRIQWGQDLLRDLIDGRYRTIVCGVNDSDNSHGIVAQLVELVQTSQWSTRSVTSFARMFQDSVAVHAAHDREPYVLKYDLDSLLILGLLRPKGRDHFTLEDLGRGFATVAKMLRDRRDRLPVASVSFLNARANRLLEHEDKSLREPSFESVLRTIYDAGYRGDVYPAPGMWGLGHIGVFASYPFPESVETMRTGGH